VSGIDIEKAKGPWYRDLGQKMGPAGVAVWASPTVDAKRRLLYVATGDSYTFPAAPTSDAARPRSPSGFCSAASRA